MKPTKIKNIPNWEYCIDKRKLREPGAERWVLERQLNYGGDQKIKLKTLLKYWPDVCIADPIFKEMLERFLQSDYVKNRVKKKEVLSS